MLSYCWLDLLHVEHEGISLQTNMQQQKEFSHDEDLPPHLRRRDFRHLLGHSGLRLHGFSATGSIVSIEDDGGRAGVAESGSQSWPV